MSRHLIPGDKTLKAIKSGDLRKRLNDGDGLYLKLFVKGGAHGWRFDYSHSGKRLTLSLGTYPDTGLALAREKADRAREQVAAGVNPSDTRKAARQVQTARRDADMREAAGLPGEGTFEAVAREWLETVHLHKVSVGHAERTLIRFEQDAFPWLGRRPLVAIEAPELLACLRRVEERGAVETAHRTKNACGQVFRYGIATGKCQRNPAADLRDALRPVVSQHHAAIIEPKHAAELLRDMVAYQGHPVTRAALGLSAMLLLRPGELRHMEWAWIDFDTATLTVPGEIMKRTKVGKANGPSHLVPLAPQAVVILREIRPLTEPSKYVFPSLLSNSRCMSENTVRGALRRMGYSNDEMTAHGFRAMARTMMKERLNIDPEYIEAQLAHAKAGANGGAYDRARYLDQRREMMIKWADYLDALREGAQVIPLRAA